jgi:hypothetical protein
MKAVEKIRAFFKRGKGAAKVEMKPEPAVAEKKTTEAGGQEGTRG